MISDGKEVVKRDMSLSPHLSGCHERIDVGVTGTHEVSGLYTSMKPQTIIPPKNP